MDALDLHPGDYAGTYKLIGGRPALDFANLVSYRGTDRAHDWLEPVANLDRWADAAGILAAPGADVEALRDLRERLARVFLAVAGRDDPAAGDIDRIGSLAATAAARRRLRFPPGADAASWTDAELSLLDQVVIDAAEILVSADTLRRVSACGECRWVFLDTTRNQRRRWCDPADCGNRSRQRRHYRRKQDRKGRITGSPIDHDHDPSANDRDPSANDHDDHDPSA